MLIVGPLNADPTNAMTSANITACVGNPYFKTSLLTLLGGPKSTIQCSMETAKIFGDPMIFSDHNFTSLVTTVPTNNWFWNVALVSTAVVAATYYVAVEITVDCEFFDRIFLPA